MSSQYLTALLMAAPLADGSGPGIDIRITDQLVSQPYVVMTLKLMQQFGVEVIPHVVPTLAPLRPSCCTVGVMSSEVWCRAIRCVKL